MYDLILQHANLLFPLGHEHPLLDLAIKDGIIQKAEADLAEPAKEVIDIKGRVVSPGFVDLHLHSDTAYLIKDGMSFATREDAENAQTAILLKKYKNLNQKEIEKDLFERGSRLLQHCVNKGTSYARTHLTPLSGQIDAPINSYFRLKEEYRDQISLQNVVPFLPEIEDTFRRYAKEGRIDVIGGYPARSGNLETAKAEMEQLIAVAVEYDLPLDIHINSKAPLASELLIHLTKEMAKRKDYRLYERVTVSHLGEIFHPDMSWNDLLDLAGRCGRVYLSMVAQTSNDVMSAGEYAGRGVLPFEQLWDSGANLCVATGDVCNVLHPFGNGDLLAEVLTTAMFQKIGITKELRRLYETITWNAARAMGLSKYGVLPGCMADIVVLDALSSEEALISQAKRYLVLKRGKIILSANEERKGDH